MTNRSRAGIILLILAPELYGCDKDTPSPTAPTIPIAAIPTPPSSLFAAARRRLWNHTGAHGAHFIDQFISDDRLLTAVQDNSMDISKLLYTTLRLSAASRFWHRIRPSITAARRSHHVMHFRSGHFRVASGSTHIAPISISRWHHFMQRFNEFAFERNGIPLLNQSPFVERTHVEAAYGGRWLEFSRWIRSVDPDGRMLRVVCSASPLTGLMR